jgi:peptidase E
VSADTPTILATSGGLTRGRRTLFGFSPLLHYAIELAGVSGRAPRVGFAGTAMGDQEGFAANFIEAGRAAGVDVSLVKVFPMPNADDLAGLVLDQDVVWVGGGSVANLLALWRLHGLDEIFRQAWTAGVVLAGVSAGSICWHTGGTTDSFGPDLRPVTNGLGFLPFANGVHYDGEEQRRPRFHQFVVEGILPGGYATDNGAGLLYRGTELAEAVAEVPGRAAYQVTLRDGEVREERLDTRLLPGA